MERGALTPAVGAHAAGKWQLAAGSLGSQLLSRDLAAVLAARIDALPAEPRSVLRDAAVVGDTVPAGALEALRERRAGRDGRPAAVAAVELERAVDELLQRRMLHRIRGGFAFATPLMREAAYAGIGKADLAERHAYLARWAAPETSTGWHDGAGRLSLTEDERDAFVADHAERAATLADAVRLRPDAPARDGRRRSGVAALGRLARRALASRRAGRRPSSTPSAPPRWPADGLPLRRPAGARPRAAAARPGRRGAARTPRRSPPNAGDDAGRAGPRRCCWPAGRTRRSATPSRAVTGLAGGAGGGHRGRAAAGARRGDAPARHGRLPRRPAEPGEQPVRRGVPGRARRAATGAGRPGRCRTWPG